jgi:hypothetical protein
MRVKIKEENFFQLTRLEFSNHRNHWKWLRLLSKLCLDSIFTFVKDYHRKVMFYSSELKF